MFLFGLKRIAAVVVLIALFTIPVFGNVASAETRIAVVNVQEILTKSKAAVSIQKQLEKEQNSLQKAVEKSEKALRAKEKDVVALQKEGKEQDFAKSKNTFEKDVFEARKDIAGKKQAIEKAAVKAVDDLRKASIKIVAEVSKDKYDLVLTQQNVIIADKSMNITDEVMKRLNESVKEIKVNIK